VQASPSLDGTQVLNEQTNLNSSIRVYDIVYNMNRGKNSYLNPGVYYEAMLPFHLMPASREGYNFAGWYLDSHYKHPVSEITDCSGGNLVLFAKWTKEISNSTNIQLYSYVTGNLTRAPEKKLSNMNYRILDGLDIPGMPKTRYEDFFENRIFSVDQCPQGMCVTDDYILVTTYSTGNRKCYGCLHVFDRNSYEYLASLSMRRGSHLGGIAWDGQAVWICHSNFSAIERLDYRLIKKIAEKKPKRTVEIPGQSAQFRVANSPSCITFYDGKLWIATHTRFFRSVMCSYRYDRETDDLEKCEQFEIPDKVQGLSFDSRGHVYLSTSFGRGKSSYIKVYESADRLSRQPDKPAECVEMPPCSEEIAILDSELLVLFESGAKKYMEGTDGGGRSLSPLDHLVAISLTSF